MKLDNAHSMFGSTITIIEPVAKKEMAMAMVATTAAYRDGEMVYQLRNASNW